MEPMLMTARMTNPAFAVDGAMDALNAVAKTVSRARIPISRELVHLRASQINGCSVCLDMHAKAARRAGESEERVYSVAAWRETPYFSDAERAALALTECLTRLADRPDQVPDAIWDAAAEHFDKPQLGALVLDIALANLWNRLNVATQQVVGEHGG
jgi:AhpD family alkylhydroperoxidase